MWQLLLPFAYGIGSLLGGKSPTKNVPWGSLATGTAMIYASSQLGHWADTNVYQTGVISEDQAKQQALSREKFEFEKERWYEEQERADLEYQRSMEQTYLIESFDERERAFQAQQQTSQMQFEANMFNARQAQIAQDRERYLQTQAFQSMKQSGIKSEDRYALAFILSELDKMMPQAPFQNEFNIEREQYLSIEDIYAEEEKILNEY